MRQFISFFVYLLLWSASSTAQITIDTILPCTSIKSQDKTGTCWSFSTTSFLESEVYRQSGRMIDLSEMYIVSKIYEEKALNYILRQGKAQFSQGSLAHDLLQAFSKYGIVPEEEFSGRHTKGAAYNHSELVRQLKEVVDIAVQHRQAPSEWMPALRNTLNIHGMYYDASSFRHAEVEYHPIQFARQLGLCATDYVHLTSFSHHPFESHCILEIPDNFSNGSYANLPIQELKDICMHALSLGFTLVWDGDVSEEGFRAKEGIATYTHNGGSITQEMRQEAFMNFSTTDDHLMHIVGLAHDVNGSPYFVIKNSWGPIGPYEGYLMMSMDYFLMKTVAISLHKEGLPAGYEWTASH